MTDLNGQVAIITGAGGNLGSAAAQAFYRAGARLVLVDRHPERASAPFGDDSSRILAHAADLTIPDEVNRLVQVVLDHFGQVDALINTVGGYRAGEPVHEMSLETWDFMLTLNARTALLLAQAVIPPMLARGSGKIVNTAARAAQAGTARHAAYAVSKSAVVRLTETLAAELRQKGINANCVLPGTIDTPENREAMPDADHDRWVAPEAIADVMLFLASDAARAIHGAAIPVYGRS